MKISLGTDICEVARIEKSLQIPRFTKKIFTEKEREYIYSKKCPAEIAAGRFCAKEAFAKALGTGIRGFEFTDIEILNDSLGCPFITVYGKAKELLGNSTATVSISHTEGYATATVIIYGQ